MSRNQVWTSVVTAIAATTAFAPFGTIFPQATIMWHVALAVVLVSIVMLPLLNWRMIWIAPASGLSALVLYLTISYAPRSAIAGIVPTPRSLSELLAACRAGINDFRQLETFSHNTDELVLVITVAAGLTATAFHVFVGILRNPAICGLVLLALYAIPTAMADGIAWHGFAFSALGYLVLLGVNHSGEVPWLMWFFVTRGIRGRFTTSAVVGVIGVASIALALALPSTMPGFPADGVRGLFNSGGQSSEDQALTPFAKLRGELQRGTSQEIVRIRTNQPQPFYLRQYVLDEMDATGWHLGDLPDGEAASGQLGLPLGVSPGPNDVQYDAEISISEDYHDRALPLYSLPTFINGLSADWRYSKDTETAFTETSDTSGLTYDQRLFAHQPTESDLRNSPVLGTSNPIMQRWGNYSRNDVAPEVISLVESLTASASSPYNRARAILDYLQPSNGFRYALRTQTGDYEDALIDFLINKEGFCQQYSSALATMLRVAGIPSRVVIGYTSGQQRDGYLSVTTHDAHAWVETYFARIGWVALDPTPLPDGRGIDLPYLPKPSDTPPTSGDASDTASAADPLPPESNSSRDVPVRPTGSTQGDKASQIAIIVAVVGAVGTIGLATPWVVRTTLRRRRLSASRSADSGRATQASWDELSAILTDYGYSPAPSQSPCAISDEIIDRLGFSGTTAANLRLVALLEERRRYAARSDAHPELEKILKQIQTAIKQVLSRRQRLRAALLPKSLRA